MNRGIGGLRYCMRCARPGDHNTADCPLWVEEKREPKQKPVMRKPAPKAKR